MTHGGMVYPAGGPVATVCLEALRMGNQEVEARIFLERALTDATKRDRLGPALHGAAAAAAAKLGNEAVTRSATRRDEGRTGR